MDVHLTFDIEVWCPGWDRLDESFPASFERYVWGRSRRGEYALPETLKILRRHGLTGTFFVEPLFSARFGRRHLRTITSLIGEAGQDIQLHLHPEWTDELAHAPIADTSQKRQHLTYYNRQEQTELIGFGRSLLEEALGHQVQAFRAGSFAANLDTFHALRANGLLADSSLNECHDHARGSLPPAGAWATHREIEGVHSFPVTVFDDGLGRRRPAQVGACSLAEMRQALEAAHAGGARHFVIVSHNFEMLKPGSSEPDSIVVRRFEGLCRWLAQQAGRLNTCALPAAPHSAPGGETRPAIGLLATAGRYAEQLARRFN